MVNQNTMGTTTHFQALIDLQAWQVFGFEGLSRFHDGRGPLEHVAQARREDRIYEFELELIETAITHTVDISSEFMITLNLSAETLESSRLDLLGNNLQGRSWGLEILESGPRADCPARVRRRATDLGCTLLVDDAGSGHSDEIQIRSMKPDIVKVDRELFYRSARDSAALDRVLSLMCEARSNDAKLLVEGLETKEQVTGALALGFDYAQGFYFGSVVPKQAIRPYLLRLHETLGVTNVGQRV